LRKKLNSGGGREFTPAANFLDFIDRSSQLFQGKLNDIDRKLFEVS